jgi:dimethylglycine dehydrogenase
VIGKVSRAGWSKEVFPWLSVRSCYIGIAPAVVMAVSFSGELAYEIHVPNSQLYAAYLALREAGDPLGLQLFGARAVDSMRLEKGYLHWKADILTEFDPFETGLERFVTMDKGDFIGKAALAERLSANRANRLVTLEVDCHHAAAHGGASVMLDGKVVGTVTSGDWGHRVNKNLAYAFVRNDLSTPGNAVTVDILGDIIAARVIEPCPYDPTNERVRA